jgi:hypothetical protein
VPQYGSYQGDVLQSDKLVRYHRRNMGIVLNENVGLVVAQ